MLDYGNGQKEITDENPPLYHIINGLFLIRCFMFFCILNQKEIKEEIGEISAFDRLKCYIILCFNLNNGYEFKQRLGKLIQN